MGMPLYLLFPSIFILSCNGNCVPIYIYIYFSFVFFNEIHSPHDLTHFFLSLLKWGMIFL